MITSSMASSIDNREALATSFPRDPVRAAQQGKSDDHTASAKDDEFSTALTGLLVTQTIIE